MKISSLKTWMKKNHKVNNDIINIINYYLQKKLCLFFHEGLTTMKRCFRVSIMKVNFSIRSTSVLIKLKTLKNDTLKEWVQSNQIP